MYTDYKTAVHWCNNALILCNNIEQLDDNIYYSLVERNDITSDTEVYQWYLTNCSDTDVEYLQNTFPSLLFCYSNVLDLWVLAVDHWGTPWNDVPIKVASVGWWEVNGKKYGYKD